MRLYIEFLGGSQPATPQCQRLVQQRALSLSCQRCRCRILASHNPSLRSAGSPARRRGLLCSRADGALWQAARRCCGPVPHAACMAGATCSQAAAAPPCPAQPALLAARQSRRPTGTSSKPLPFPGAAALPTCGTNGVGVTGQPSPNALQCRKNRRDVSTCSQGSCSIGMGSPALRKASRLSLVCLSMPCRHGASASDLLQQAALTTSACNCPAHPRPPLGPLGTTLQPALNNRHCRLHCPQGHPPTPTAV